MWRDSQQQWRAFEDLCPHRKVLLSEGRVHQEEGTLECAYHGELCRPRLGLLPLRGARGCSPPLTMHPHT